MKAETALFLSWRWFQFSKNELPWVNAQALMCMGKKKPHVPLGENCPWNQAIRDRNKDVGAS